MLLLYSLLKNIQTNQKWIWKFEKKGEGTVKQLDKCGGSVACTIGQMHFVYEICY